MSPLCEWRRYFIVIPLFSAFVWFSSLLAMLLTWLITGRPKYVPQQVAVVYISDISASFLKPLFVVACCITGPGLVLSLAIERLVRHKGRLPPELRTREHTLSRLAILGGMIAMCGLALLSGFDTGSYRTAHLGLFILFMFGLALSVIFTVVEFHWLARDYADVDKLKRMYVAKGVIGSSLVVLAMIFAVTSYQAANVGGVIEWLMGFGFTFYLLALAYDLRPARVVGASDVSKEGMVQTP